LNRRSEADIGAFTTKAHLVHKADLYAKRSEGPVSALGVDRHERPLADIDYRSQCRGAAFPKQTLIDRAAFRCAEVGSAGRSRHPF
jgi:hypothetical protein